MTFMNTPVPSRKKASKTRKDQRAPRSMSKVNTGAWSAINNLTDRQKKRLNVEGH